MKEYHELTADKVLRLSIICLVFVIINAFIVRKEMRTRLRGEARFGRSKSLKWLSLFSIIGGLLHAMTRLLSRVDGVCYFTTELSDVIALTHPIIVGLHQLALLYHSFSRFKAPPGFAGYPNWLFVGMTIFAVTYTVCIVTMLYLRVVTVRCGMTAHYGFYTERVSFLDVNVFVILLLLGIFLYSIWNLTNLLLFIIKLRSLTLSSEASVTRASLSTDPRDHENSRLPDHSVPFFTRTSSDEFNLIRNVRRKMTRIVILTIFYMIPTMITSIIHFVDVYFFTRTHWVWLMEVTLYRLQTTIMSYAVFLMLPHNENEYGVFLKWITRLKLHFCCCCYYETVKDQLDYFLPVYLRKGTYKRTASGVELMTPLKKTMKKLNSAEITEMETATAPTENSMLPTPSNRYLAPKMPNHQAFASNDSLPTIQEDYADLAGFVELNSPSPPLQCASPSHTPGHTPKHTPQHTPCQSTDILSLLPTIEEDYSLKQVKEDEDIAPVVTPMSLQTHASAFLFETGSNGNSSGQHSNDFGFGIYLEYWRLKRHNAVKPKYKDLKEELMNNKYAAITSKQYQDLQQKCTKLLDQIRASSKWSKSLLAKDVGTMNNVCQIRAGAPMTLDHMMAVKFYTDFTKQQAIFKKHCRRKYREETVESVKERNSEIANWCRLMRECIIFYGDTMSAKEAVYCGMNAHLVFNSLHQRFECPLSTSSDRIVALRFAGGSSGMVLKLKRANPQTRYLDVANYSVYTEEKEKLFMGSTLKIVDILIGRQWLTLFVSALSILEQIIDGHFIDSDVEAREFLLAIITKIVSLSLMDLLSVQLNVKPAQYLNDHLYDTDAIVFDLEDENDSNIIGMLGDKRGIAEFRSAVQQHYGIQLPASPKSPKIITDSPITTANTPRAGRESLETRPTLLRRLIRNIHSTEHDQNTLSISEIMNSDTNTTLNVDEMPEYAWLTVGNYLDNIRDMAARGMLWLNYEELNRSEFVEIREALLGNGKLFDYLEIDKEYIRSVSQYKWVIEGDEYSELRELAASDYMVSPEYRYEIKGEGHITFHFRCYGQYSDDNRNVAIFLEIDEMLDDAERLTVEMDVKCIGKGIEYKQLLRARVLTQRNGVCGFETFERERLDDSECIEWVFAMKMYDAGRDSYGRSLSGLY